MNSALATRRLYRFENSEIMLAKKWPGAPIKSLRKLAERIAADWKRKPPKVVSGNGTRCSGMWGSYQQGSKIVLARHHRFKMIVLHEMAHYLARPGERSHGAQFCRRYFRLLSRHAAMDYRQLCTNARAAGVEV